MNVTETAVRMPVFVRKFYHMRPRTTLRISRYQLHDNIHRRQTHIVGKVGANAKRKPDLSSAKSSNVLHLFIIQCIGKRDGFRKRVDT